VLHYFIIWLSVLAFKLDLSMLNEQLVIGQKVLAVPISETAHVIDFFLLNLEA
jgi:hypothetical protein